MTKTAADAGMFEIMAFTVDGTHYGDLICDTCSLTSSSVGGAGQARRWPP